MTHSSVGCRAVSFDSNVLQDSSLCARNGILLGCVRGPSGRIQSGCYEPL